MEGRSLPGKASACVLATTAAGLLAVGMHAACDGPGPAGPAGVVLPMIAAWWIGTAARWGYGPSGWLPVPVALTAAHLAAGMAPLAVLVLPVELEDPIGSGLGLLGFAIAHPLAVLREGGAPAAVNLFSAILSAWTARPGRVAEVAPRG